ncbi:MAG TPA: MaoC/PaaZ C-terminal domain-containing protein [Ramlibacter sp.]|nr:MaoC/PaaZ C-terminal domain-containing protein [Ramlibacter sp.]
MPIDYRQIKDYPFPEVRQTYQDRDTMLYALSLGVGQDPMDPAALAYVYEGSPGGLRVLPTQAVVLGHPGFWIQDPALGIDWVKVLHGEQRLHMHRPLPPAATLIGRNRVTRLIDKGEGKGALIVVERRLEDEAGTLYATVESVTFCRGDGGYSQARGGQPSDEPPTPLQATPEDRAPDQVDDQPIRPEAALIYRLLADRNPLHADPGVARKAGFERPILHGLAGYGLACRAVLRRCAGDDPTRLRSFQLRFASPMYPGETLRTEMWVDGSTVRFRARMVERNVVVLSHGTATLA